MLVVLGVVLGMGCLTAGGAQSAIVPIPSGVVIGRTGTSSFCQPYICTTDVVFNGVTAVGRLKIGETTLSVVLHARRMQYEIVTYWFCQKACPLPNVFLVEPFDLTGFSGGARAPFAATCTSGTIADAVVAAAVSVGPVFSASCDGGTDPVNGPFSFRFLVPGGVSGPAGVFAGGLLGTS